MGGLLSNLHSIIGRAARDVRDLRDTRKIRWQQVPDTDLMLLGGNWMAAGAEHEGEELALFKEALAGADAVIDIGANSGLFSLIAARAGKQVFAFEPLPANLRYLSENLEKNGLADRVEVFPVAVSDTIGFARFYGRGQGASLVAGWATQPEYDFQIVPVNRLDNLLAARLAGLTVLLKLDVEGAELQVLRGAGEVLRLCDTVLLEHSLSRNHPGRRNPHFSALFELMWAAGFEARVAQIGGQVVTPQQVDAWVAAGRHDLGTENFLFTRP